MQERQQARALVWLDEHEDQDQPSGDQAQPAEVAHRHPGGDQERPDRERDNHRRPQIRLDQDQQACGPGDHGDRRDRLAKVAHAFGVVGEVACHVQHQRELHHLGGLELDRPGGEPASRPEHPHAEAGDHHHQQQAERAKQHQAHEAAVQQRQPAPLEQVHRCEAGGAEHEVAHEFGGPVSPPLQHPDRRGRAVDHDRAERQQAQRRGHQDPMLKRRRHPLGGRPPPRRLRGRLTHPATLRRPGLLSLPAGSHRRWFRPVTQLRVTQLRIMITTH